jgi:excisionase family DNA binding protein
VQAEVRQEWLTYKEAEQRVGLSRTTLYKLISAGELKVRRVGRAVRINREGLDAYMKCSPDGPTTRVS